MPCNACHRVNVVTTKYVIKPYQKVDWTRLQFNPYLCFWPCKVWQNQVLYFYDHEPFSKIIKAANYIWFWHDENALSRLQEYPGFTSYNINTWNTLIIYLCTVLSVLSTNQGNVNLLIKTPISVLDLRSCFVWKLELAWLFIFERNQTLYLRGHEVKIPSCLLIV